MPPISTSNTNPLKNADGSVFKGTGGTYLVVLQTATSYSDCASVYIINNKSITQLYSGRDRSPVVSYSEEVGGYVAGLKQYDTAMTVYYGIVRII